MSKFLRPTLFSVLCLGALSLISAIPVQGQGILKEIIRRMNNHQKLLTSVKADVERSQTNAQLRVVDKYEGELVMIPREGAKFAFRLDWKTENGKAKSETISVVKGKYILLQPAIRRATVGTSGASPRIGASAFKALNMSEKELRANYDPQYIAEETLKDGTKTWHLKLLPKTKPGFKFVDLWVDSDGMPRQTTITALNSDTDTFLLTRIKKNETVKGETFSIAIPPGFETVKN